MLMCFLKKHPALVLIIIAFLLGMIILIYANKIMNTKKEAFKHSQKHAYYDSYQLLKKYRRWFPHDKNALLEYVRSRQKCIEPNRRHLYQALYAIQKSGIDPLTDVRLLSTLSNLHFRLERYQKAAAYGYKSLNIDRTRYEMFHIYLASLLKLNDQNKLETFFENEDEVKNQWFYHYYYILFMLKQQKSKDEILLYCSTVEKNHSNNEIKIVIAFTSLLFQQFEKVSHQLESLVKIKTNDVHFIKLLLTIIINSNDQLSLYKYIETNPNILQKSIISQQILTYLYGRNDYQSILNITQLIDLKKLDPQLKYICLISMLHLGVNDIRELIHETFNQEPLQKSIKTLLINKLNPIQNTRNETLIILRKILSYYPQSPFCNTLAV
jgi:hypothetical protein